MQFAPMLTLTLPFLITNAHVNLDTLEMDLPLVLDVPCRAVLRIMSVLLEPILAFVIQPLEFANARIRSLGFLQMVLVDAFLVK